jgi:hypothetical protein
MIIDVNTARGKWLLARNPDLMGECEWRLERLYNSVFTKTQTETFEVTFNSETEKAVLREYLKGLGYNFEFHSALGKTVINISIL